MATSAALAVLAAGLTVTPAAAAESSTATTASSTDSASGLNLLLRADPWKTIQTRRAPDGSWDQAREVPQFAGLWYWSLAVDGGRLRMFGAQMAGQGFHYVQSARNPDGTWAPLSEMTGLTDLPHDPQYPSMGRITATRVAGQVQVAAVDGTGRVVHTIERPDGTWQPWGTVSASSGLGSGQFSSLSTAEVNGELQMVGTTSAGEVLHTIRHADGNWSAWGNVMGVTGTPSPWGPPADVAAASFNGSLQVVVTDNSQAGFYHTIRNADGTWNRWGDIGSQVHFDRAGFHGFIMGGVEGANVDGELQLVFESSDNSGSLYHTIRHTDGTWAQAGLVQRAVDLSAWRPVSNGAAAAG
ncbi:hypothetical protein [Kitasatospora sp. NPDC017646]|uniref:hypothetical protein n=1 Tax=Kitasatospora sp. NPDC017646 TaxID=3364024 RepID=UPI0037AAA053